ncbi:DUF1559 domain-containing protein [Planctomyces sp. SH-PL62]|uniref:DUF1559 domain-containing protein n=1 Tax=Planctomyces sp. SH-PL62 TaxID=1636152 RepID=UPI00078BC472|nr:DUF1559 domain-containing protein [Planctomyces sp. SH-PL62]AMV40728.1 Type II secretion system protein G precursor [Planctomyces sp. SH-PL62]
MTSRAPERREKARRPGFTLIEIAVVVVVIALLIALLVPAVQSAREAARRAQCSKNLGQLALAIHAYESSVGTLPMGTSGTTFSLHAAILPHMEQSTLYSSINFSINGVHPPAENRTAAETTVGVFLCPSDSHPGGAGASTNYAGNAGGGVQKYGRNGSFVGAGERPPRSSDFTDGAGNTSLMAEWQVSGGSLRNRERLRAVFATPRPLMEPEELEEFVESCRGLDLENAKLGPPRKGRNWLFGDMGWTLYNHTNTPNGNTCTNGTAVQKGAWTAGSGHSFGVNVSFADGHVQFIHENIHREVWRALASCNGREILPSSF